MSYPGSIKRPYQYIGTLLNTRGGETVDGM